MNIAHVPQRRRRHPASRRGQRGIVLLVALIVLGLMFLAGLGVMRAVDTSNVISGNFSFQQSAVQASDRAATDALNNLAGFVVGGGGNNDVPNRYMAQRAVALDARGIPTVINWDAGGVNCVDPSGAATPGGDCAADNGNYRVQYFIERMCTGLPVMTNVNSIRALCEYEATTPTPTTAAGVPVRYRVLIRVRGPRGTDGFYEVMVSGPASL